MSISDLMLHHCPVTQHPPTTLDDVWYLKHHLLLQERLFSAVSSASPALFFDLCMADPFLPLLSPQRLFSPINVLCICLFIFCGICNLQHRKCSINILKQMNRWNLKHYFYDTRCQLSLLLVTINNNGNDTLHLLSDYYMPGTILSTSHILLHSPSSPTRQLPLLFPFKKIN